MRSSKLRWYEVFRAVMITGSVTGAATLLGRTQPSISRTIAELETHSGAPLFERDGRRLKPTAHALDLLPDVEAALRGFAVLDRKFETLSLPTPAELSIAITPHYSTSVAPLVITRLRAQYPDLRTNLIVRDPSVIADLVETGQADIGLGGLATGSKLERRIIGRNSLVCALPAGHRLEERREITASDLNDEDFIAFDHEITPIHMTEQIVERAGGAPRTVVQTQRTQMACALVAEGVGLTLVAPLAGLSFPANRLVMRRFKPDVSHSVILLKRLGAPPSSVIHLAHTMIEEAIALLTDQVTERLDLNTTTAPR